MARCPYHQPDWSRLVRIMHESLTHTDECVNDPLDVTTHPEYKQLSPEEREWLSTLIVDPIEWDDNDNSLTNGQHRLCALRAANVTACPVRGQFLHDTDYGPVNNSTDHARTAIKASGRQFATEHGWPAWLGAILTALPANVRKLLLNRD
jgi:hypothetical protein